MRSADDEPMQSDGFCPLPITRSPRPMLFSADVRIRELFLFAFSGVLYLASTGLAPSALGQVRINEVDYEDKWVELYNAGTESVDVSGYQLCTYPSYNDISSLTGQSTVTIAAGSFLVVDWNPLSNTSGDPHGEVGLYVEGANFSSAADMLDYMEFGESDHFRESVAVDAGEWQSGEFVALAPSGKTLSFFDSPGEIGEEDWDASNETKGSANDPIPVELTSFEATTAGVSVQLSWWTASETNNAGFEVQHRNGNSGFDAVAFMDGSGTTSDPQKYEYTVSDLAPGTHVFRLRQVDLDGSSSLTSPVEAHVSLRSAARLSTIRPSPATSTAHLSLAVRETQPVTVRVYDLLGRTVTTVYAGVLREGPARRFAIDTQQLSSGTYLLRANGPSFVETQQFVVAK